AATNNASIAAAFYALDSDLETLARAETDLARLLMADGELDAAERHARKALQFCDDHGLHPSARSYCLLTVAEIRLKGKFSEPAVGFEEAVGAGEADLEHMRFARGT